MKNSPKKTIFITCFHLLASRNILTSDVFGELTKTPDLRIILLVSDYKKDFFCQHYQRDNVLIVGVDEAALRAQGLGFFKWLTFRLIPVYTTKLRCWEILHQSRHRLKDYLEYGLSRFISLVFSRLKPIRFVVRKLDLFFSAHYLFHSYFDDYRPDCLFATDVFSFFDTAFLQAAKTKGVFALGMVRSWDNTTTKGLLRFIPDKLIVNNEIIAEEAVQYHDIKAEDIFVGGIPQYDLSFRSDHALRKDFFEKIDVDPQKRLILFAPAGSILSDTDWQLCEILKRAFSEKKLPDDLHFLVRNHPGCLPKLEKFEADSHFTIEWPGTGFKDINYKYRELSPDDARHLIDSLYHSQLVISVNSTITIDALPFDKPQIIIEFDGWETKPYIESVRRYHDEDHMRKYLNTGAAKVVLRAQELYDAINQYLENPALDREQRKLAMGQQLYYLDGDSGKRIAEFIIGQI